MVSVTYAFLLIRSLCHVYWFSSLVEHPLYILTKSLKAVELILLSSKRCFSPPPASKTGNYNNTRVTIITSVWDSKLIHNWMNIYRYMIWWMNLVTLKCYFTAVRFLNVWCYIGADQHLQCSMMQKRKAW